MPHPNEIRGHPWAGGRVHEVSVDRCGVDGRVLVEGSVDFANVLDYEKFAE